MSRYVCPSSQKQKNVPNVGGDGVAHLVVSVIDDLHDEKIDQMRGGKLTYIGTLTETSY